ncbi:MAG: adenylosuccinate synthase [Acidobacteriia bacterium]|nr:adenylosuccinate synthase [Terriglobia bacterium]
MPNVAVVGAQWGDEGKGKVVDLLSERFDVVARYQGGPNAGHTVTVDGRRHALHHIPSGAFRPDVRVVVGNGTVLDLPKLIEEIDTLAAAGIDLTGRLQLSDRAHVILPEMARLDDLGETAGHLAPRLGTTRKGIGPAYEAKAARLGIRLADLADRDALLARVRALAEARLEKLLGPAGGAPDPEALVRDAREWWARLSPYVADTSLLLNDWMDEGLSVLFEGAQGTLLDLDHGSYPFVTSSSTVAGGLCAGLGVSPRRVDGVLGVFKAYTTRVGDGPMPTELRDGPEGVGERLRKRGHEYGTTTGRPRRCGWFDGVAAAYAHRLNRFDAACVTLLDVLDESEEIRVCTGYRLDGRSVLSLPASPAAAARVEAEFETLPGWRSDTTGTRRFEDLPVEAQAYLERLGQMIGAEVGLVSVGPDRSQSIVKPGSWLARMMGT